MKSYLTMTSPIGKLTLVACDDALIALYVKDEPMPLMEGATLNKTHSLLMEAAKQLEEYFRGERRDFDLKLNPGGTEFQTQVWNTLLEIPFGSIWSYGKQADFMKAKKNSQRAVGGANGKNPIPVIIPCHRVIGSTGKLTGFAGGMEMKTFLLKLEGHEVDPHGLKVTTQLSLL